MNWNFVQKWFILHLSQLRMIIYTQNLYTQNLYIIPKFDWKGIWIIEWIFQFRFILFPVIYPLNIFTHKIVEENSYNWGCSVSENSFEHSFLIFRKHYIKDSKYLYRNLEWKFQIYNNNTTNRYVSPKLITTRLMFLSTNFP